MPAEPLEGPEESLVSKKITSLSLSKVELETKITKPKFVPEKLDFQLYEKFEGKELFLILYYSCVMMFKQKLFIYEVS